MSTKKLEKQFHDCKETFVIQTKNCREFKTFDKNLMRNDVVNVVNGLKHIEQMQKTYKTSKNRIA